MWDEGGFKGDIPNHLIQWKCDQVPPVLKEIPYLVTQERGEHPNEKDKPTASPDHLPYVHPALILPEKANKHNSKVQCALCEHWCKCENFTYEGFYIAISYLQTYFINKWSPLEVQLENHFKNKQQQQRLNWKVSCFKRKKPPTKKTLKASVTHFSIQSDGCKGRLYYLVLWVKFSSFASLLFKSFWN